MVGGWAAVWLGQGRAQRPGQRRRRPLPAPTSPLPAIPAGAQLPVKGITPYLTSRSDFYRIDTALVVPRLTTDDWSLRIHGLVEREVRLTWDQLLALPMIERLVTLSCVSNEVGGDLIGNAMWLGHPLKDLLAQAESDQPNADMVLSKSIDGFTAGSPLAALTDGRDAMIAIGMNGEVLPQEHGFPARLVVPGLYGYVSATKWVVDLEVTRFDQAEGYWTPRGWSPMGPIKTESRIDVPRDGSRVSGPATVAVAGRRLGRAPRDREGRGAGRRRRLGPRPAGRRAEHRHLAAVGLRVAGDAGQAPPAGAGHRRQRRPPDPVRGAAAARTGPPAGTPSTSR